MRRIINYLFLIFIFSFIFLTNVKAECSYQERKQMLKETKNVDISVEPVLNENNEYDFKFNIINLTKNLFIKYYNTNNGETKVLNYDLSDEGVISFVDTNTYLVYDYKFEFYSTNNNCYADKISSKSITKPKYNIYSENVNCSNDVFENFKYCAKFLNKDENISLDEFYEKLLDYNEQQEEKEIVENNNSFFVKYSLAIIILLLIFIILIILFVFRKKRSEKL